MNWNKCPECGEELLLPDKRDCPAHGDVKGQHFMEHGTEYMLWRLEGIAVWEHPDCTEEEVTVLRRAYDTLKRLNDGVKIGA